MRRHFSLMISQRLLNSASSIDSCDSIYFTLEYQKKGKVSNSHSLKRHCKEIYDSPQLVESEQDCDTSIDDIDLTSTDTLDDDSDFEGDTLNASSLVHGVGGKTLLAQDVLNKGPTKKLCIKTGCEVFDEPRIFRSPSSLGYFVPQLLPPDSYLVRSVSVYGFSPYTISLGTSYFQRLAAIDPQLRKEAETCLEFAPFVQYLPDDTHKYQKGRVIGAAHKIQGPKIWLLAIYHCCIYLAAKLLEAVPYLHLLQSMLQRLHRLAISKDQAESLEADILIALDFRLGPFYLLKE